MPATILENHQSAAREPSSDHLREWRKIGERLHRQQLENGKLIVV
jgi:hypothetical protein